MELRSRLRKITTRPQAATAKSQKRGQRLFTRERNHTGPMQMTEASELSLSFPPVAPALVSGGEAMPLERSMTSESSELSLSFPPGPTGASPFMSAPFPETKTTPAGCPSSSSRLALRGGHGALVALFDCACLGLTPPPLLLNRKLKCDRLEANPRGSRSSS